MDVDVGLPFEFEFEFEFRAPVPVPRCVFGDTRDNAAYIDAPELDADVDAVGGDRRAPAPTPTPISAGSSGNPIDGARGGNSTGLLLGELEHPLEEPSSSSSSSSSS